MAVPVEKDFPQCADGDVVILLSTMQTYKLHSQVLSRASTFFAEQLSQPAAPLTYKARREGAGSYHFELTVPLKFGDVFGRLEQRVGPSSRFGLRVTNFEQELQENGKPKFSIFARTDVDQLLASGNSIRYWDLLLGAFYGIPIKFKDDNMAVLLEDCSGLLDVAETVGSVECIREKVDLSLMRQDKVLWKSIYTNPAAWVGLGARIQSPAIFREAVVHLVGNWQNIDFNVKANLAAEVRQVVERKYQYIEKFKVIVECRINMHYPRSTWRRAEDKPGCGEYAKEIYMWMACAFYRHWFNFQVITDNTRRAKDGGHEFYHNIWKSGNHYLKHEEFARLHCFFPMSRKACNILENSVMDLKDEVRPCVSDIIVNRTHIPAKELKYLTCAVLEKTDFPWEIDHNIEANINQADPEFAVVDTDSEDDKPPPKKSSKKSSKKGISLPQELDYGAFDPAAPPRPSAEPAPAFDSPIGARIFYLHDEMMREIQNESQAQSKGRRPDKPVEAPKSPPKTPIMQRARSVTPPEKPEAPKAPVRRKLGRPKRARAGTVTVTEAGSPVSGAATNASAPDAIKINNTKHRQGCLSATTPPGSPPPYLSKMMPAIYAAHAAKQAAGVKRKRKRTNPPKLRKAPDFTSRGSDIDPTGPSSAGIEGLEDPFVDSSPSPSPSPPSKRHKYDHTAINEPPKRKINVKIVPKPDVVRGVTPPAEAITNVGFGLRLSREPPDHLAKKQYNTIPPPYVSYTPEGTPSPDALAMLDTFISASVIGAGLTFPPTPSMSTPGTEVAEQVANEVVEMIRADMAEDDPNAE